MLAAVKPKSEEWVTVSHSPEALLLITALVAAAVGLILKYIVHVNPTITWSLIGAGGGLFLISLVTFIVKCVKDYKLYHLNSADKAFIQANKGKLILYGYLWIRETHVAVYKEDSKEYTKCKDQNGVDTSRWVRVQQDMQVDFTSSQGKWDKEVDALIKSYVINKHEVEQSLAIIHNGQKIKLVNNNNSKLKNFEKIKIYKRLFIQKLRDLIKYIPPLSQQAKYFNKD